jgi:hypothetical protein
MKTLGQIREEYNANFLDGFAPDELMFESSIESPRAKGGSLMPTKGIPSAKEMPVMLLFRRTSYRIYPNKQVVALYYSSMIDKYLSIPFGPGGNVNLSEATIHDTLDEDWQDVNRKDKTDGLSQKAVNAYRRENPGSKLQTAVTEKNPSGKRASRRKSFCSRMGGMKKRLTSAKTARDPDSRINKALRRWNCEEEFKTKLSTIREEQQNEWVVPALGAAARLAAGTAAGELAIGAAKKYGSKAIAGATELGKKVLDKVRGKKSLKDVMTSSSKKPKTPKSGGGFASSAAGSAVGSAIGSGEGGSPESSAAKGTFGDKTYGGFHRQIGGIKTGSSFSKSRANADAVAASKVKQAELKSARQQVQENKISDIRNMISEGIESLELPINGRQVTLNTSMAKRILEVYDSVNIKNKKIVEGMLNEDLESFKRLLNFSIRN